jgi:predicted O-methyltransferase YrrM
MHSETVSQYLARLYPPERQAFISSTELQDFVPVVDDDVARLLGLLLDLSGARRVLELGTSIGFSTLRLAESVARRGGEVVTLEFDPEVAAQARRNFARRGLGDRIRLLEGDARALLPRLEGPFDAVFLDLDKHLYLPLLEDCLRLLRPGGLLLAEDTLFPVLDLEPRWHGLIPPIEAFNRRVAGDPRLASCILPIGDGLTLAWKCPRD